MTQPYDLLCEARELLCKAHDKIAAATDYRGRHNAMLVDVCPAIEALTENIHDACGLCCPSSKKPRPIGDCLEDRVSDSM